MRALVWDGSAAAVVDHPEGPLPAGYARVRVRRAGVCSTDLQILRGYMGFRGVLGHELVGSVVEGPAEWLGRRVVAEINFACGACPSCAAGLGRHCPTRSVLGIAGADGAFAERVAVPVANLHAVPDAVDDEAAVLVEPLAAALEILEQVPIAPGTDCTVLGDGKLGQLVAEVLHAHGARVLVVGKHAQKLARLAAHGLATTLYEAWDRRPAAVVVEATGSASGFAAALGAVRPRGTLVLKSTIAGATTADLAPLVIHELTVVGSRCGPFAPALAMLEAGRVDTAGLITATLPLERGAEALALAATPGALKVLLAP